MLRLQLRMANGWAWKVRRWFGRDRLTPAAHGRGIFGKLPRLGSFDLPASHCAIRLCYKILPFSVHSQRCQPADLWVHSLTLLWQNVVAPLVFKDLFPAIR